MKGEKGFLTTCALASGTVIKSPRPQSSLRISGERRETTASAHFQRYHVALRAFAGLVVHRALEVAPVAGEVVGADQEQGFVDGGPQLQCPGFRRQREDGGRGLGAVDRDQAASGKFCDARVAGAGMLR